MLAKKYSSIRESREITKCTPDLTSIDEQYILQPLATGSSIAGAHALISIFRLITKQKAERKPVIGREARLSRLPLTEFDSALQCHSEK